VRLSGLAALGRAVSLREQVVDGEEGANLFRLDVYRHGRAWNHQARRSTSAATKVDDALKGAQVDKGNR